MAIDRSGKGWKVTEATDIGDYPSIYMSDRYGMDEYRPSTCVCGGSCFRLDIDREEGVARRTCVACRTTHMIGDSAEFWADADPQRIKCVCRRTAFNVGEGCAMRAGRQDVRWMYVGSRCTRCGGLGSYADWKVDYSPSLHLLYGA